MEFVQASQAIGFAADLARISVSTISLPGAETPRLLKVLEDINREFLQEPVRRGGAGWPWTFGETAFTLSTDTESAQASIVAGNPIGLLLGLTYSAPASIIGPSSNSLLLESTTDWASSGAGVLWLDVTGSTGSYYTYATSGDYWRGNLFSSFTYSGADYTANQLTGVSGISLTLAQNAAVQQIYQLPSDFGALRGEKGSQEGVYVSGRLYPFAASTPLSNTCNILELDGGSYIWLPRQTTGTLMVLYTKAPVTLASETGYLQIPLEHQKFVVYRLLAHLHRAMGRGEQAAQEAEAVADAQLSRALGTRNQNRRVRTLL